MKFSKPNFTFFREFETKNFAQRCTISLKFREQNFTGDLAIFVPDNGVVPWIELK